MLQYCRSGRIINLTINLHIILMLLEVFSFLTAEELSRAAALQSALRRVAEHEVSVKRELHGHKNCCSIASFTAPFWDG